jgi:hypothetical protein
VFGRERYDQRATAKRCIVRGQDQAAVPLSCKGFQRTLDVDGIIANKHCNRRHSE